MLKEYKGGFYVLGAALGLGAIDAYSPMLAAFLFGLGFGVLLRDAWK